jgi:putative transposase
MARKLRVEYAGAIYHVMNRGDRKEAIFLDDDDRHLFLKTLAEACQRADWQLHAYCLMGNHFHLVVETPKGNLVAGMMWLLGTYTARFNRRHKLAGHLFSGRYKALIIDGSGTGYLKTACDYVHLNPTRAKLLKPEQRLEEYRWSSWPEYLKPQGKRCPWLRVDRLLGQWGIEHDDELGRWQLEQGMEHRKEQEQNLECADWNKLRRSWCWGPLGFQEKLLELVGQRQGKHHYGEELRESDEQKALRLISEMLGKAGWTEAELKFRRKGDPIKAWIAARLRAETTMTWPWIAARLSMGHWRTAFNAIRRRVLARPLKELHNSHP